MDAKVSTKTKTKRFQNLNKNCRLVLQIGKTKGSMDFFNNMQGKKVKIQ